MTWNPASAWATSLDPYGSGVTGWRLPETNPVNGTAYHFGRPFDGTSDEGYNVSAPGTTYAGSTGSEMAHLFYNTLGNLADYDTTGRSQSGGGLTNTGPFSNLQSYHYWSATTDPRDTTRAWNFFMPDGSQLGYSKSSESFAWAVHAGDVGTAVVPVPAALWLFVGGLVSLAGLARRHAAEG